MNGARHALDDIRPVAGCRLSEQPEGRIPGGIVAADEPAPVAGARQGQKYLAPECAGQMCDRGVRTDDEIETHHGGGSVGEGTSVLIEALAQGFDAVTEVSRCNLLLAKALLQRDQPYAIDAGERSQRGQGKRPAAVEAKIGATLPGDADLEARAAETLAPMDDALRIGREVGCAPRHRVRHDSQHMWNTHDRQPTGALACSQGGDVGDHLLNSRHGTQQRRRGGVGPEHNTVAKLCEVRGKTGKLDAITEPLLALQNQNVLAQGLAIPTREWWGFEVVRNAHAERVPPFKSRPALAPIALKQVQVGYVIEHFVVASSECERSLGVGPTLVQPTEFGERRRATRTQPGREQRIGAYRR